MHNVLTKYTCKAAHIPDLVGSRGRQRNYANSQCIRKWNNSQLVDIDCIPLAALLFWYAYLERVRQISSNNNMNYNLHICSNKY